MRWGAKRPTWVGLNPQPVLLVPWLAPVGVRYGGSAVGVATQPGTWSLGGRGRLSPPPDWGMSGPTEALSPLPSLEAWAR